MYTEVNFRVIFAHGGFYTEVYDKSNVGMSQQPVKAFIRADAAATGGLVSDVLSNVGAALELNDEREED